MFGKKTNSNEVEKNYDLEIKEINHNHNIEIRELKKDHELALKENEFILKHFKDEEVQGLKKELSQKEQELAVLQKENEMLIKITNLNADIIDIKDLVSKLIDKLPEVNLTNLTLNAPNK